MLNVTAAANSTRLLLSWQRPEGDLDSLVIELATNGTGRWRSALPPDATQVSVDQLTPGRAYTAVVASHSGALASQSEASFRTGQPPPAALCPDLWWS